MGRPKTVFIVGAGASDDFGFPVGKNLQNEIADFIRPNRDSGLHTAIVLGLDELRKRGMGEQQLFSHCQWMADTLPLYPSIDSFLDKQSQGDDATSFIGKLAIASIIAAREAQCSLVLKSKRDEVDWPSLSKTWIGKVWSLCNEGGVARLADNPLPEISFITFNYDRCIEQFITLAISQSYRIEYSEASAICCKIPCEHVYGSLGQIGSDEPGSGFGVNNYPSQFLQLVPRIKTFAEQVDSNTHFRIKEILNNSDRVIFLGFSFGKINQKFLDSVRNPEGRLKQVFGTSYDMSPEDRASAQDWSDNCFRRSHAGSRLQDMKASTFFDKNYLLF